MAHSPTCTQWDGLPHAVPFSPPPRKKIPGGGKIFSPRKTVGFPPTGGGAAHRWGESADAVGKIRAQRLRKTRNLEHETIRGTPKIPIFKSGWGYSGE